MSINHVVHQGKALTGQNKPAEGQRALTAAYQEAARENEMPNPPHGGWGAWIRLGQQAGRRLFNLKNLWLWNRI